MKDFKLCSDPHCPECVAKVEAMLVVCQLWLRKRKESKKARLQLVKKCQVKPQTA